jgi:hypothetical protein
MSVWDARWRLPSPFQGEGWEGFVPSPFQGEGWVGVCVPPFQGEGWEGVRHASRIASTTASRFFTTCALLKRRTR